MRGECITHAFKNVTLNSNAVVPVTRADSGRPVREGAAGPCANMQALLG